MAPTKERTGELTMKGALQSISSGAQKERGSGLDDLIFLLDRKGNTAKLSEVKDIGYHGIFEVLFKCTITEKENYFSTKKNTSTSAASRLSKCAEALRLAINHGASKLKRKTVLAVIRHITQTLPGPDQDFIEPLVQDYIKSIVAVLAHQANVEHLSTHDAEGWLGCVDFCVDSIAHYLESAERDSGSRASPAPGTAQNFSLPYSTARSGSNSTQRHHGQLHRASLQELLHCLHYLVLPPNAPLSKRAKQISGSIIQVLQLRHLALSQITQFAFATLNVLLANVQADNIAHASTLARELVPLICHWWQGRTVSKDEMLNSVRDEMLKTILIIRLPLQRLSLGAEDDALRKDIEDLVEVLWLEYTRRDYRAQLQLDDLTFVPASLPADYFKLDIFGLRPHNHEGERKWALVQILSHLESILWQANRQRRPLPAAGEEHPRKRRRAVAATSRLQEKLNSSNTAVQRTALQLIPFILPFKVLSAAEISELLSDVTVLISDKLGTTSSWAMLACSSCAVYTSEPTERSPWKQVWQIAARSVGLPGTCRAACVLLHSILESNLVSYHSIADDINSIVTTADVNGPAILVDSSITLMLHLLYMRNAKLPSASQSTCHHIIRWIFLKWSPADMTFASLHSVHAIPSELVNLIRACCGNGLLPQISPEPVSGGSISQAWKTHCEAAAITRYLLLLDEPDLAPRTSTICKLASEATDLSQASDSASFHASKKLVLELFSPKIEELQELCETWAKRGAEGGAQISPEKLQSLFSACIVGAMLIPQLLDLNSRQSRDIEPGLFKLLEATLSAVIDSPDNQVFFDLLLRTIRPYAPHLATSNLTILSKEYPYLLRLFAILAATLHQRSIRQSSGQNQDFMDLDDEFDSQQSRASSIAKPMDVPRQNISMSLNSNAFYQDTTLRLYLLEAIHKDSSQVGLVPESFLDQLLILSDEGLLSCNAMMIEVFQSDLVISPDDALRVIQRLGEIIGQAEYTNCEVAHCTCLDIMDGLVRVWLDDKHDIAAMAGDLYNYFVKASLPNNGLSPKAQGSLASLLLTLLRVDYQYGTRLGLSSCRTTLLSILKDGTMQVKHLIATQLPDIFGLYVLKMHDDIFVDVLASLPTDPEEVEGIAFRLFALAEMACRWPTLLRRCTYHIFETPGNIPSSTQYATRCLTKTSNALQLASPKELFNLFCPQLLYTWLDSGSIDNIPFEIFGFASLEELLTTAQAEAAALMIMRGQEESAVNLAHKLSITPVDMIKKGFPKVLAYSIAHDMSVPGPDNLTSESRVRKRLGREPYLDSIYANFVDIVALFFDLFDQEDPIEKYFAQDDNFAYAATIMGEIKKLSHSPVTLPANQQPMFKAKHLLREIFHLCSKTEYELHTIWTPALVVLIARRLFNTVHPALGSLHACSVLRKVRVLVCLAGPVALESYPLEMLLHSIRPFIVDSECADDALGISQYIISKGRKHLVQVPSFLAGYSLSTLAALRVFLESSQSSTTQESQFKATMSKAQQFHAWFGTYLVEYESPAFKDEDQRSAFKSITQSASRIRSSGNAEKGTHESNLLLEILKDGEREDKLLNEAARDLALGMLCGDFNIPSSSRQDVIESDEQALQHGGLVWKSCKANALSTEYLAWAGRVVGRSFAASGEIQQEMLRESHLSQYSKLSSGSNGSEQGILALLQRLTMSKDSFTAGLAESALRAVVSEAEAQEDDVLLVAGHKTLSEALFLASEWNQYRTPPSDISLSAYTHDSQILSREQIEKPEWIQLLATHLAKSVPEYTILSVLSPILTHVKGFAEEAFPFIAHLGLCSQLDKQHVIKRTLSEAMKEWLTVDSEASRENLKYLINTMLYLRIQQLPNENSIADRSQWLDIDFSAASSAASRCGMYKTALLFVEVAASQTIRVSRRSSAVRESDSTDVLLAIFENIDDPDAYYGVPQASNLSTVLARLEYEKDGSKSLAFRGAQFDSHIRQRDSASGLDGQFLVRALSTLGLTGLSHSLLQTQQSIDGTAASLDSTFQTARRLEIWNLPAPGSSDNHAVTIYKAYQSIHQSVDVLAVRNAIYDGFGQIMRNLANQGLNAASLRHHLGALAVLAELDDVINITDFAELEDMLPKFEHRGQWMRRGRYEDVSQILSCRETTLSMLSQHPKLRAPANLSTAEARQVEIRSLLMSSGIYRFHQATQESLNLSTSLTDLIAPCEDLGLNIDAAIRIEAANSLWDHGEMIPSIRMLQSIDSDSALKKQTVPVSRSDLLSKIGHQVSVAKLEKPQDIQKRYLEPALKELKGKNEGKEAGQVFHQFAMFCDEQLQNSDGLEDLARLQSLRKGKSDEVTQLKTLISGARDSQMRTRYSTHLARAKTWLDLDEQELRRVEQTRSEFVRLSIENYLLSLIASDEHNNDALRFTALWLERSDEDSTNDAARKYLDKVTTRKFAPLMNQLSSRLQDKSNLFQKLLITLVHNICVEHPYHSMYQIWSGTKTRANAKDEVAVLRHKATEKVAKQLSTNSSVAAVWQALDRTSKYYHLFAVDKDPAKYKAGHKIALKDCQTGQNLVHYLAKYQIPPPTMQFELAVDKDYSKVPIITKLEPQMTIASGVSAPKIITAVGSDGKRYRQLVKGGNDDLRQDAIMEQVFAAVSSLLKLHRATQQRKLGIRTYKVLPLTSASGLIEFVPNTIPLHEFLMPAHERYFPKDLKGPQCRKEISNVQNKTVETRISTYRKVTERFHPVMRYFFMENFVDPDEWFVKRLAYTRATAAISMLGHVLGLGDRHGHNILLDSKTGEVVHIDLGVAFEMGRVLPVPELVPFRMTRDIVDGMGVTKTEGVFRRCCEFTLDALRDETYSIMTILDVLRYDPLYSWSISPVRLAKLQNARRDEDAGEDDGDQTETEIKKTKKGTSRVNEPSEAERALEVVRKKLSKTLSVTATVNDLINQATDERNLAVLYSGWAAYA